MPRQHFLIVGVGSNESILFRLLDRIVTLGHVYSFIFYERAFLPPTTDLDRIKAKAVSFHSVSDPYDGSILRACVAINAEHRIDRALTTEDFLVLPLAEACEKLGVRGVAAKAAFLSKDKKAIQQALHEAGMPSIKSAVVEDFLDKQGLGFRFPLILKPVAGVASVNVFRVESLEEIKNLMRTLRASESRLPKSIGQNGTYLVEEYLRGLLFSVECLVQADQFKVLAISLRQRADRSEVVELGSIIPAPFDEKKIADIENFARRICEIIDFRIGICHVELMWTEEGLRLMDFNPRLPGVGIPRMIEQVYEYDLVEAILQAHQEEDISHVPTEARWVVGNRLLGLMEDAIIPSQLPDLSWAEALGLTITITRTGSIGAVVSNFDYFGEILCRGTAVEEVLETLDRATDRLEEQLGCRLIRWSPFDRKESLKYCVLSLQESV